MTRYSSLPPFPARIARLDDLAVDLWWTWHADSRAVFRRLDYGSWRATAHNPVRMLWIMPRAKLEAAAADPAFLEIYDRAIAALEDARAARNTWWSTLPHGNGHSIAYFSAEFALHQSLPIYAGGLGVLAGDHCKEASDLGVGGVRALKALGAQPGAFHLNEGHAGFVVLQRIRDLIEHGSTFDEALEEIRQTTIFTTHTPVPAGHDAFPFHLVEKHLAGCWGTLGANRDRFLALGAYDNGGGPQFNMTALAIRSSGSTNAVSQLHGEVTRAMFGPMWPDLPEAARPVSAVTNGVHVPTWIAGEMVELFTKYLGSEWLDRHDDPALWDGVLAIPDEELWRARQSLRRYLFTFIRDRARQRWMVEHVGIPRVVAAGSLLEPDALTIGFARRFTGYKRPELVFYDPERLARILNADGRPVQIIFAGKSHPADEIGKHHLQRVYKRALDPMFGGRIALVDDYDLHVAHFLVQGCDVWLNNPRKPLEASGTSGMKAAINGVPHLSIGDGWWAEGFTGNNGWVINGAAAEDNYDAVDAADAGALYRLLEEEVVPAFYDRDGKDVPHRWIATVKESIRTVAPRFSGRRMVKEYAERMYATAFERRTVTRS